MRSLVAIALTASLITAGCTTPDGQFDPGATAGLALGLAAVGGIAYLASQGDDGPRHHGRDHYRGRDYRGGYDGYYYRR
jgi:hypothetical protein